MKVLVVSQYFWPESFRINELVRSLAIRGGRLGGLQESLIIQKVLCLVGTVHLGVSARDISMLKLIEFL